MSALAALVTQGHRLADVGCDHGYIPIYLCLTDRIPSAIAMDINQGPLARAEAHIAAYGLRERIQTRQSDGLKELCEDEADTVLIAGMGGFLMKRILSEEHAVPRSVSELVLQPQSDICEVRRSLRELGFVIADEDMVEEDGKFYPMMKAKRVRESCGNTGDGMNSDAREIDGSVQTTDSHITADPGQSHLERLCEDTFGPVLLKKRHLVLRRWLEKEKMTAEQILLRLDAACADRTRDDRVPDNRLIVRRDEILQRRDLLLHALLYYQ